MEEDSHFVGPVASHVQTLPIYSRDSFTNTATSHSAPRGSSTSVVVVQHSLASVEPEHEETLPELMKRPLPPGLQESIEDMLDNAITTACEYAVVPDARLNAPKPTKRFTL